MRKTERGFGSQQWCRRVARRGIEITAAAALFGSVLALAAGDAWAASHVRGTRGRGLAGPGMAPHNSSTTAPSSPSGQPEGRIAGPMDSLECPNGGASGAISVLGIQVLLSSDTSFEGVASCDALAALTSPPVVELKVQGTLGSFVATEVQVEDSNNDNTAGGTDSTGSEDDGGSSSSSTAPTTTQP